MRFFPPEIIVDQPDGTQMRHKNCIIEITPADPDVDISPLSPFRCGQPMPVTTYTLIPFSAELPATETLDYPILLTTESAIILLT